MASSLKLWTNLCQRWSSSAGGHTHRPINEQLGKNFYDFINAYRVEAFKAKLQDPKFAAYSILGVALESGFKSKSSFNAIFKKVTGMTPSQYKKGLVD